MMAPSFGDLEYWNDRYTDNTQSYDWLNEADILDKQIVDALSKCQDDSPQLLHIGCGNSDLSFTLRLRVKDPGQINNLDYSSVVVDWGRQKEKESFDARWGDDEDDEPSYQGSMPMMRWSQCDLLDLQSLIASCKPGAYSIIVDKSTVDSIACTSTTQVSVPYYLYTDSEEAGNAEPQALDLLHTYMGTTNAVQLLAVHLAFVSKPGATWIAYSYSSTRFWFLDPTWSEGSSEHDPLPISQHVPHPKQLWKLVKKRNVSKPYSGGEAMTETKPGVAGNTHFLYILRRTSTPVKVKSIMPTADKVSTKTLSDEELVRDAEGAD